MTIGVFNELDLLLIVIVILGSLLGMSRGVTTQFISMISFWLGLVVSLWLYNPLSKQIILGVFQSMNPNIADMIAFLVIFGLIFHAIRLIATYLINPPQDEERRRKEESKRRRRREREGIEDPPLQKYLLGPLNLLGGLVFGVILTVFWWSLLLGMLQFILQGAFLQFAPAWLQSFSFSMNTSFLIPWFNTVLYWIFLSVSLFVPADASIVQFMLENILFTRG